MGLRCGIIGLANVGKTTLFNCISNTRVPAGAGAGKANVGVVNVPDPRLRELESFQKTEKLVPTTVEFVDIPGLTRGGTADSGGNRFLSEIRNTDLLIHVLRCFDSPVVAHIDGSVNPVRDLENIEIELQARDLESVEKKMQRVEKGAKAGDKDAKKVLEILQKYKTHLEGMQSVRTLEVTDEERKVAADLFLLSEKPVLYVCNVEDRSAVKGNAYVDQVRKALEGHNAEILVIAAGAEADIAELETEAERLEFLNELGLDEPGVNKLVRVAFHLLDLMVFFTVGPKEIRAWTIKRGMAAPQAAGVIHSDLEKGFIRAEVMKYQDFITLGSEHACKEKGRFFVEGKNYIVCDGDILHIRFNV